jgi:UDP-3-O-[3-hydroxymyristoyl] glucosamine N-acyltransferase
MMGGHVGIREHTIVGRGARLGAQAVVMNDVPPGESWVGTPARPVKSFFREYAVLRRLPTFMKEMKRANEKVSG